MKNLLKALFCATLFCALALGFAVTEVRAATYALQVEIILVYNDNPVEGVEVTLRYNSTSIQTETSSVNGSASFITDFTTADIPNLVVTVSSTNWTSNQTLVPLNSFDNFDEGFLFLVWEVFPVTSVEDPPTEVNDPPPTTGRVLRFSIGSTTYTDNGVNRTLEAAPFIENDRTLVPLRVIAEALGATQLAHNAGVITFNIDGQAFTMTVGQALPGNMGTPVIVADRTFVPLAYIINEMGGNARWDRVARVAYIYIE